MHRSENFRKLAKIFILTFLCSEMHSTFMHSDAAEHPFRAYPSSINGTETPQQRARHQASIRLALEDYIFGEGHICGGAVIAPSVVLTVAQCLYNYKTNTPRHPLELKVVMGTLNRYQRNEQTLIYGVTHVHRPTTFDAQTLRDNIAIIMLERDIPYGHPTVKPITLYTTYFYDTKQATSTPAAATQQIYEVTSWFATEQQVPYTQLMSVNLTQLQQQQCNSLTNGQYDNFGILCMGYKHELNSSACLQDIGAPLLYKNQLVALNSYGSNCSKSLSPMVYIDVNYYVKWISEHVGDGHNQNSSWLGTLFFIGFTAWTFKRSKWLRIAF